MAENTKKTRRPEDGARGYEDWEPKDVERSWRQTEMVLEKDCDKDSDWGQSEFHPQVDVRETLDPHTKSHLFSLIAIPLTAPAI